MACLSDGEMAEHRRFVRGAVVLVLSLPQVDRDSLCALERHGREVLREAVWPIEGEAMQRRTVVDHELVRARLQSLHSLAGRVAQCDLERVVDSRVPDQLPGRACTC